MNKPKFKRGDKVFAIMISKQYDSSPNIQYPYIRATTIKGIVNDYGEDESEAHYIYCIDFHEGGTVFNTGNWLEEDRICKSKKDVKKMVENYFSEYFFQ